jgi:hypothetical protein
VQSPPDGHLTTLFGDPLAFAPVQFRIANDACGACRDYHALWPYRRLSGLIAGVEADADIIQPRLRDATPRSGRVLICGAGDAGVLGLAADALADLSPQLHVADRCSTPLATCRAFGEREGLAVATHAIDLAEAMPPERFDAVLAHLFVQFVSPAHRVSFFLAMRERMSRSSSLIIVERAGPKIAKGGDADLVAALKMRGVALPENEADLRARAENLVRARGPRLERLTPDLLRQTLAEARFRIREWYQHSRRTTEAGEDGARENVTYIVTASPA